MSVITEQKHVSPRLAEAFAARKSMHANRSSAVFPVYLRPGTDVHIAYLDYWRLKNHIETVTCVLRVYDAEGALVRRHAELVNRAHNRHSLRSLLGDGDFDGMIEVEFLSGDNLRFPFPGIVAFYQSGGNFSVVHSAGRIKNSDEPFRRALCEETNWSCKAAPGITPFFHVFNGPAHCEDDRIVVRLYGSDGRVLAKRDHRTGLTKSFSSAVIRLDSLFNLADFTDEFFVGVTLPTAECFPRLVVGNLHVDENFLEVTHSFAAVSDDDLVRVPADRALTFLSFLPAITVPELSLDVISFPTNAAAEVTASVRRAGDGESLCETDRTLTWITGGPGARTQRFSLGEHDRLISLDFRQGPVPARLNASYRYRVRGTTTNYSTDLGTGAKSWVYPDKQHHWGHGIVSGDYETAILIRNMRHNLADSRPVRGTFTLYLEGGGTFTTAVDIAPEGHAAIYARSLLVDVPVEPTIVSWLLHTENTGYAVETFWTAFAADGRVCGEHGF